MILRLGRRGPGFEPRNSPFVSNFDPWLAHKGIFNSIVDFVSDFQLGSWCSGITSASHAEGPGFKSQWVHFCRKVGEVEFAEKSAHAGNRTRGTSMGSLYVTTTLRALLNLKLVFRMHCHSCDFILLAAIKKLQHPRIELGTFRVLGGRHNH